MSLIKFTSNSNVKIFGKTIFAAPSVIAFPSNGLRAFYKLEDLSDSSGNERTLTNNGGVTFTAGKIGDAATFDTTSQWLANSTVPLIAQDAVTISLWVKGAGTESPLALFHTGSTGSNNSGLGLYADDSNKLQFTPFNNENLEYRMDSYQNNIWYHAVIVATKSGTSSTWQYYVDGTLAATRSTSGEAFWFPQNGILVGRSVEGQFGVGQVDALGLWNRPLSLEEIQLLYSNGNGLEPQGTLEGSEDDIEGSSGSNGEGSSGSNGEGIGTDQL